MESRETTNLKNFPASKRNYVSLFALRKSEEQNIFLAQLLRFHFLKIKALMPALKIPLKAKRRKQPAQQVLRTR